MSTSPFSPITLNSVSQYSSDYQSILNRAVQIAQLPVTALQNKDSDILQQKTLLGSLDSSVGALAASLSSLGTLASNKALSATSSDPTAVSVTNSGATAPATYTINSITSAASAASERTTAGYADASATPVSSTGKMNLVVGSQTYALNLTTNTLVGVRDQINGLGAGVTASILTTPSGNYLTVTANATGVTTLKLNDDPTGANTNVLTGPAGPISEQSNASFADTTTVPVSSTGTVDLVVDGKDNTFTLTSNNLTSLRDQINGLSAGVTASIVTDASGNHLHVAANGTGTSSIKLIDDPTGAKTNLLSSTHPPSQGSNAVFQLNGIPISQPGNVVNNVIPGVSFSILGASTTPVTLSLSSDRTQLSSALQDLVAKFNDTESQVRAQIGPGAGQLSGDTIISEISNTLRQLTTYSASTGSVRTLADLGVTFDNSGKLNFNQTTFDSLSDRQISDAFTFLGSATSGLGGFSATLTGYSDPIFGMIKAEEDGIDRTDQSLQNQIGTLTDRITTMQTNLAAQLNAADAAESLLQSQQQTLTASLQGLNLVLYGKNQNQTA